MGHLHTPGQVDKAFLNGITLELLFSRIEWLYRLWIGSLALIGNAGHNSSNMISLISFLVAGAMLLEPGGKRFDAREHSASSDQAWSRQEPNLADGPCSDAPSWTSEQTDGHSCKMQGR